MSSLLILCFWTSASLIGVLIVMTVFNAVTAIRLEKAGTPRNQKKVSLLIPLRNEAHRIPELLRALKALQDPQLEILLLDDESTDGTPALLAKEKGGLIQVFSGQPLPLGWWGKSWACHQLFEKATGEVLLFCDADVTMTPQSIQRTLFWMEKTSAGAVTALPFQEFRSWWEASVIPFIMHLPILGLLPLQLLSRIRHPAVLVANGQWFAIHRSAYIESGGHEGVKGSLIEDMALGRSLIRSGFSVLPVLATEDLKVHMYDSWKALQEGFTKNLYALCGGSTWGVCSVWVGSFLVYGFPLIFVAQRSPAFAVLLGGLVLFRMLSAWVFKAPLVSVLGHPVGAVLFFYLVCRSWSAQRQGKITWKGRSVSPA